MKVKCFNGELAYRKNVRRIKGQYYLHKDITRIGDQYHRCTNPKTIRYEEDGKLYATNQIESSRLRRSESVKVYIVPGNKILYERVISSLPPMALTNKIYYANDGMYIGANVTEENLKSISDKVELIHIEENDAYVIPTNDDETNKSLVYTAKEYQGKMYEKLYYSMHKHDAMFKNFKYKSKTELGLDHLLDGLTFGAEFETSSGKITSKKLMQLGLAPLRDGSIKNYEYTTVPMKSINHLYDTIQEIQKTCTVSYHDSLHFHIGNVPSTPSFLMKSFVLSSMLQEELYKMVPSYKLYDKHHIKRRGDNYTNPLPVYKRYLNPIDRIINFLSDGNHTSMGSKKEPHPSDPSGDHKWQIRNRYTCINYVPFVYGPGDRTVEFRIHQGTTNQYKTIYWLLICVAMIRYAKLVTYADLRKSEPTLAIVLKTVFPAGIARVLNSYIDERKNYYATYNVEDKTYRADNSYDNEYEPKSKLWEAHAIA